MITIDFYFYHIEKCAGTTLRNLLYENVKSVLNNNQIHIPACNLPENANSPNFIKSGKGNLDYYKNIKVIADHSRPNQLAEMLKCEVKLNFSVVALRKPYERVLSHYHYFGKKKYPYTSMAEMPKDEFEKFMRSVGNLQTRKLSFPHYSVEKAIETLKTIDCIILSEHFDYSMELLSKTNPYGYSFKKGVKLNVTSTRKKEDYTTYYDDEFQERIR